MPLILSFFFFFLMIRRPPRSTLFPYTRSSDLAPFAGAVHQCLVAVQDRAAAMGALSARAALHVVEVPGDRKSTRLNSSHLVISYAVFCLKKKNLNYCPVDSALPQRTCRQRSLW